VYGAMIECQDNEGRTPLHVASVNNATDVLKVKSLWTDKSIKRFLGASW